MTPEQRAEKVLDCLPTDIWDQQEIAAGIIAAAIRKSINDYRQYAIARIARWREAIGPDDDWQGGYASGLGRAESVITENPPHTETPARSAAAQEASE